MVQDDRLVLRELFGGAVEMQVPTRLQDVSDFRPVPDNQEVFADAQLDQSVIVEILNIAHSSRQEYFLNILQEHAQVSDAEAGPHMFNDFATGNDALSSTIDTTETLGPEAIPSLPQGTFVSVVHGQQVASKGQQGADAANIVQVLLCVIRLPSHQTDIAITLNTPMVISQNSAAAEHAGAGAKHAHENAPQLFRSMLATLIVKDYSLFGG